MLAIPYLQSFCKEDIGVVKHLLLNEQPIFGDEDELLGRTLIDKFVMIVTMRRLLTCPTSL